MTDWDRLHKQAQIMKERYPAGTRIMLLHMSDNLNPVPPNTKGTVDHVDDIGTLHCTFDNGRGFGVVPGEDSFRTLTDEELAEEQSADESEAPTMGM